MKKRRERIRVEIWKKKLMGFINIVGELKVEEIKLHKVVRIKKKNDSGIFIFGFLGAK